MPCGNDLRFAGPTRVLVRDEVARFDKWLSSLDVVPTIAALRKRGEAIAAQVLKENELRWETLSQQDRERLDVLARALVSRLLHEPTLRMKRAAEGKSSYMYAQAVRELFGLDSDVSEVAQYSPPADVTSLEERRRAQRSR